MSRQFYLLALCKMTEVFIIRKLNSLKCKSLACCSSDQTFLICVLFVSSLMPCCINHTAAELSEAWGKGIFVVELADKYTC